MTECKSCGKKKIKYFMKHGEEVCQKCYDENSHLHFRHECVFTTQMNYRHVDKEHVEIDMTSGKVGIYNRQIDDKFSKGGTGQHDYKFTFIKYKIEK